MVYAALLAAALTPLQMCFAAQEAWEARTFDHWCSTVEIDQDLSQPRTSRGPNCLGPAYSPLGFNISSVYPASTQPDPFAPSQLPVIANVRAIHYEVTLAGEERIGGLPVYHLVLRPINAPEHYPLRALWRESRRVERYD